MKTRKVFNLFQVVLLGTMAVYSTLARNGTLDDSSALTVPVKPQVHKVQAKELLGKSWVESFARRGSSDRIAQMVRNQASQSLPKGDRKKAGKLARAVMAAGLKYNLDPLFIMAVIKTESKFDPRARGFHGEIGLMQIRPPTARWMAKKLGIPWRGDQALTDPAYNIHIGAGYFALLREKYPSKAPDYVSAYNMGPRKLGMLKKKSIRPEKYLNLVTANYIYMNHQLRQFQNYTTRVIASE
jgi:soluble lytic murein transglycosylase